MAAKWKDLMIKKDLETIYKEINDICKDKYEFLGFCDKDGNITNEWVDANKTRLLLKCLKCGFLWNVFFKSLKYTQVNCPKCFVNSRKCDREKSLSIINEICKRMNCTFLGVKDDKWIGNETILEIKCNKCLYTWYPTFHNFKENKSHCLKCQISKLERDVEEFLTDEGISFEYQKKFNWLGRQSLDFYIPKQHIAIECQGIQHFEPRDFSGHNKERALINFEYQKERDERKYRLCEENNIKILYYRDKTSIGELKQKISDYN